MPTQTISELLTADDYRATPAGSRYQLVDGDLHPMAPAPNRFHQDVVLNVAEILRAHVRRHALGNVYVAPIDVYLDDHNVVQPDVIFVSAANAKILADDGMHGAPDLVVEVLSPSSASLEKTKLRIYARSGVKEMWLVDPMLRQVHLYDSAKHASKAVALIDEEESFGSALLPGLTIQAAEVFRR